MHPEHAIVHRLARITRPVGESTESVASPNQIAVSRLAARGRRLAQRFLTCKHRGNTQFTNAAEINEAIRRTGWNATLTAANLASYCEAAEQPQFWGRGDDQGQLARHQVFSRWEDEAGTGAKKVKESVNELEIAVEEFAQEFGIVFE